MALPARLAPAWSSPDTVHRPVATARSAIVASGVPSPPPSERLAPSLEVLATVLRRTSVAIAVAATGADGAAPVVVFANQAYLDLFCADSADVVGGGVGTDGAPIVLDDLGERLAHCARSGCGVRVRTIERRGDGGVFRARWRLDPIIDGTGAVTHVVAVPEDVTTEDRRRRRLRAVEVFTARLSAPPDRPGRRDSPSAGLVELRAPEALVAAVDVVVDGLGEASVTLGGRLRAGGGGRADRPAKTGRHFYAIGDHGTVVVELAAGTRSLYDHRSVRTLAERTAELLDRAAR